MTERQRLRINLCPSCTNLLAGLQREHGNQAMSEASGAIIAKCPECSRQLPEELKQSLLAGEMSTTWKGPEA